MLTAFTFELILPNGSTTTMTAVAERWRWREAYASACRQAEASSGLPPYSGIRCSAYSVEAYAAEVVEFPTPVNRSRAA